MKNYLSYIIVLSAVILFLGSCRKSFLDVDPKGEQLESNYYQSADEAYAALIAAYNPLAWEAGGSSSTYIDPLGPLNSASDECYAGGGSSSDVPYWQAWNTYTLTAALGPQSGFWDRSFTGIYRANLLLSKIDNVPDLSASVKSRYIAEAKFLRGYYYFWLVRLFKNIPLSTAPITTSEMYKQTQVSPDSVYSQIEKDLKEAIPDLPATIDASENGRVTKGAAQALLGKTILFQNITDRMLEAAGYFEQVNTASNYSLLTNYADIFSPDNKFNSESVFEIAHTGEQNANWGNWPDFSGNVYVNMVGPRSYSGPNYWSGGWGFNPIIADFVNAIKTDPRYQYIVANIDSIANAGGSYLPGYQNTGYFIQKFAPLAKYVSAVATVELNFPNDYIEIRLADTYLMEAEAIVRGGGDVSKAQHYLDAVRARVGLSSVSATLNNIYKERKVELATEGHRWFDLVRTNQASSVLAFKGFVSGKHELLPIPLSELNNTQLNQNPGY